MEKPENVDNPFFRKLSILKQADIFLPFKTGIGVFDLTTSGKVSIIHLTREPLVSAHLTAGKISQK